MKKIMPVICLLFIACASIDVYINKNNLKGKVNKILIVDFEKRYMRFDPFMGNNFKDALQFELLKLGYEVRVLPDGISSDTKEAKNNQPIEGNIKDLSKKYSSDLIISGIISEKEYGDAIETKTSTSIVLSLYNKEGEKVGEARYISSDTIENAKTIKKISSTLAGIIHKEI